MNSAVFPCNCGSRALAHSTRYTAKRRMEPKMTIAAGIVCTDGIVICADSESSNDEIKFPSYKFASIPQMMILTGSGMTAAFNAASQDMESNFAKLAPRDCEEARTRVCDTIQKFYKDCVQPYWGSDHENFPHLSLLIGLRCLDGALALIKTQNLYAEFIPDCAVTANHTGIAMFNHWASYFFKEKLPARVTARIALSIFEEICPRISGCGAPYIAQIMLKDQADTIEERSSGKMLPLSDFAAKTIKGIESDLVSRN